MAVPFDPELKLRQLDGDVQAIYRQLADLSATQARHTVRLDQIAAVQDQQSTTLAEHSASLADHTATLAEHSATLADHTATLAEHSATLADHTATLADHTATLADHTTTLAGHGQMLSTLVDGMASLDTKVDRILAHLDEDDAES